MAIVSTPAQSHPGELDGNGCHYHKGQIRYHCEKEMPPNPRTDAPVKKSRTNVCHDKSSPNYSTIRRFIDFESMGDCVKSGGRRYGS